MTISVPPAPSPDWCLFLDVDGTLIDFTDSPFNPHASDELKRLLSTVSGRLGGALALVSGRSIETLDALFDPLRLPAAGLHGVERRTPSGVTENGAPPSARLDCARAALRRLVDSHPGTLLEDKDRTLALHFRLAPGTGGVLQLAVDAIAADLGPDYEIQAGDLVLEIKPRGMDKGEAVKAFLAESPFRGRVPVYVGDDLTDLNGLRVVENLGGIAIAVGDRIAGTYRLEDPAAVRAWLRGFTQC